MNWYLKVLKQYSDFDGRARRMEYWMFTLINFLISIALYAPALYFMIDSENPMLFSLYAIYSLGVFIPNLAVSVRRLHDVGKSGWYLLISLIPLVGGIWLLVLLFTDSDEGTNEYGPNPKTAKAVFEETLDSDLI